MDSKDNWFRITENYDSIKDELVFSELLTVLMAYAYKLIGNSTLRLSTNRENLAYDFSMEAITSYLKNPQKFDSTRNADLVNYLKYNILRQLISNFKKSKGQTNELIFKTDDESTDALNNSFIESNDIHQVIDLNDTIQIIQKDLIDNPELATLFDYRYIKDYKRSEVCQELEISTAEFDLRIKRLATIMKKVIEKQKG